MPDSRQKRTEVRPEVVFLGKLVERVAAGKIRVPRFQRAFVWKQPDLSALLDSVLRGFPIGSILGGCPGFSGRSVATPARL